MAETSGIAWTRSTFNPWIGCTKVGPGCDGCYAEALDKRMRFGGATHWGAGMPRYRTSAENWEKPLAWNKAAPESTFAGRKGLWPVFCASLADVFDNEVLDEWRWDLWTLILHTQNLSWLLVTKRIGGVKSMVPQMWLRRGFPLNVRILITVVNQEEADRDIPKLLALPCKNGISYEPALGPVDWREFLLRPLTPDERANIPGDPVPKRVLDTWLKFRNESPRIEWLIVGGESNQPGHPARPFNVQWARSTVEQCKAAGVPVFVKQIGSHPQGFIGHTPCGAIKFKDRAGADPAEWPEDLRVREFPE